MTEVEIIRSMSEKQAREISQVIRFAKSGDIEAWHTAIEGMDVDTVDLLIAYVEAVQAERKGAAT